MGRVGGWRAGGEAGGSGAADKRSLLFPHRSLHAGSLGAAGACAARASCRGKVVGRGGGVSISSERIIAVMQFNISVLSSFFPPSHLSVI